jgi:hypothetical protein
MKILIAGDTHGNASSLLPKISMAQALGIQKVLVVGDFGLWTHTLDGQLFLDEVQAAAFKANLTVHAIGGNHENWDHWNWMVENLPQSKGWAYIRSRILLAPKTHSWKWNNKKFVGVGGAVSVDRQWRLEMEQGRYRDPITGRLKPPTGTGTLYWPNEVLTDQDVHKIKMEHNSADYLITHDCSNKTPWNGRLKADVDSERHRRKIDEILLAVNPGLHFHGHMHTKYDWPNFVGERDGKPVYVQTYGLENDREFWSWGILDTDTDKFTWRDSGEEE